ncbi:4'-phosphopantetheinyl transferase superfamily protein [Desulfobacterales bacterium HSG16]|nr:4'-phosphopantetheinyl transferase superfamily protein [Desulfobacterales bacterium HSG16]
MNPEQSSICCVHPIILAIPERARQLKPREKNRFLSEQARKSLRICGRKHGIQINDLKKNDKGAPIPFDGLYWSLTHKPEYVAGVLSPIPIGIDIEKIRSVADRMLDKIADPTEWNLSDGDRLTNFFRYWTAKEAVLKATGIGLSGLSSCKILTIDTKDRLSVRFFDITWQIEHFYFDRHIASITKDRFAIDWILQ